jgi:hypothetical protein
MVEEFGLEKILKEGNMTCSRYYVGIWLEELGKPRRTSV